MVFEDKETSHSIVNRRKVGASPINHPLPIGKLYKNANKVRLISLDGRASR
jgi:hypothetical protein